MKRLQSAGVGSKKRQAEVLTEEDEELLWQKGLLGDATPQTLVDMHHGLHEWPLFCFAKWQRA